MIKHIRSVMKKTLWGGIMDRDEVLDTALIEDLTEKAILEKRSEGGEQSRQRKQQVKGLRACS